MQPRLPVRERSAVNREGHGPVESRDYNAAAKDLMDMKRNYAIITAIMMTMLGVTEVYSMTAREIIEKSENVIRGDTQIGVMTITVKTRRWTRAMKLKMWDSRIGKKSFGEITEPKKDAGNRFLMIKQNDASLHTQPAEGYTDISLHDAPVLDGLRFHQR